MVQAIDNISHSVPRAEVKEIRENGAGTYNADFFIPAGSILLDVFAHNEVLWAAATSAALVAGDFASSVVDGVNTIGAAIDADGFIASTNLKATDLLAGESVNFDKHGGLASAYSTGGTSTHILERLSLVDRFVRFTITSVGAGAAGRTFVGVVFAAPTADAVITQ
jgi:hypothetical protein